MTKQAYREERRISPMGAEGLNICRRIVAEHQFAKVNEVAVDGYSASAIVQVYDALNETNRAKLLSMPVGKVATVCFRLIKQQVAA